MNPMHNDSHSFWLIHDGDPTVLSQVTVASSNSVEGLKDTIREKLCWDMPTSQIVLWKLNMLIYPTLDTSLERKDFADQIKLMQLDPDSDDPPGIVQLRYPDRKVSFYWGNNDPPSECLHLIVQLRCTSKVYRWLHSEATVTPKQPKRPSVLSEDEDPDRKRARVTTAKPFDTITNNLLELHRLFWGVSDSPLFITNHVKIPDARSLKAGKVKKFETINLPHPIHFPDGSSTLMITEIFKTFREQLRHDYDAWVQVQRSSISFKFNDPSHSTVISGQPGIGKTMFLNDVLVYRLQAKMVTIFCNTAGSAHVFSDSGVRRVSLIHEDRIPELDDDLRSCALVNLGGQLLQPPAQFYPIYRLGRLVVAALPDPAHVTCFKEHSALTYYMPTWDWDSLYCGSLVHAGKLSSDTRPVVVDAKHNECLREAYWKFAGIPRICYQASLASGIEGHCDKIRIALESIKSISDFARAIHGSSPFKQEASHYVIKIEPIPGTHWRQFRSELKSSFISQLVFERVCLQQTIKPSEDISRLLLNRDHSGRLFEPAARRAFERGIEIEPTPITPNAPPLVFATRKADPNVTRWFYTLSVRAAPRSQIAHSKYFGQYLLPISKTQESIDAVVIYELFTVFLQMMVSTSHGIRLNGILDILKELPSKAKKNLYIVFVVPSDDRETGSIGPQKIISPQGASAEDIALVTGIPQYVYRLPLKTINKL